MNRDNTAAQFSSHVVCSGSGHSDALFERAWNTVHFDLQRRALHLVRGDRGAAEELVADTAIKALTYMRRMPGRIRNPEGFLFVVLSHVFLDHVRHSDREDRVLRFSADFDDDHCAEAVAPSPQPLDVVEMRESLSALSMAIEQLPPSWRQLFALKFEQDLPYAVIAERLQINEALARKRVELLRRRLRRAVG
ncbi:RNA polymerase sigma factor [Dyella acidiphila]|uniref:RNA polymerase sigma factor n=1 Tax=Dyella acidiphila TaxID=2775866 RepID=A0ABR9G9M6_9GAMM|nr:RNA polymerase sigma factor [Dyella acidiphila]MBE1160754.1 RNA polymerase sigma factor [Dyella acidiphila]